MTRIYYRSLGYRGHWPVADFENWYTAMLFLETREYSMTGVIMKGANGPQIGKRRAYGSGVDLKRLPPPPRRKLFCSTPRNPKDNSATSRKSV